MDNEKKYEAAVKAFYPNAKYHYGKETFVIKPPMPLKSIGIIIGTSFVVAIILAIILKDFCVASVLILGGLALAFFWGYKDSKEKYLTEEELELLLRNYTGSGGSY